MQKSPFQILFLLLTLSFTTCSPLQSQTERRQHMYQAYVNGQMNTWVQIISKMEKTTGNQTLAWHLELTEYYYGLAGYYIDRKKNSLAAPIISKGQDLLNKLVKKHPDNATILAYKGAFIAYRISLNKFMMVTLGLESLKWLEKAYETDPNNLQAITDRANGYVFTPAAFGGDLDKALLLYQKGIAWYEKRNQANGNWLYLNLLVSTAKAYVRHKQPEKARALYKKALQIEPQFRWVKNELLPALPTPPAT